MANYYRVLAENRQARFNYEILETHEAGIELLGTEVKAVKGGASKSKRCLWDCA